MEIIAHRGFWAQSSEKNTFSSFKKALENGYGIETDVRDLSGDIVISHDLPLGREDRLDSFLSLYGELGSHTILALNIKSDGLQEQLLNLFSKHSITNYFLFDMSIPDHIKSKNDFITYCRQSEYEEINNRVYSFSQGVWFDLFERAINKKDLEVIQKYIDEGKKVCIVSPELHGRDYLNDWEKIKNYLPINSNELSLCTDYPDKAEEFFYGEN
tara:strand:- start:667 stop:1308 length:642 start_codon:yes stop_codon:yes gene_type:complete